MIGVGVNVQRQRVLERGQPPLAPAGLTASTDANRRITLTWNNPNDPSITGYEQQRVRDGSTFPWAAIPGSNASTNHVTYSSQPVGRYVFRIRAVNQFGTSPASNDASVTVGAVPTAPAGLTSSISGFDVTLTWDNPSDSSISSYQWQRTSGGSTVGWNTISGSGSGTTSYVFVGLPLGMHTLRIRAVNVLGEGPSSEVDVTVGTVPAQPQGLSGSAFGSSITLTWDDPLDPSIDQYDYEQTVGGVVSGWTIAPDSSVTLRRIILTGRSTGTYSYRIRAHNDLGTGPPSESVTVTV